jgi:predicted nucleic acid-binding protein
MIGIDTSFLVCLETEGHRFENACRQLFEKFTTDAETLALQPSVLSEFVHTVTDARRLTHPLSVAEALERAWDWWNAEGIWQVFPDAASTELFFEWMHTHRLGRKRLSDTMLAASYWTAGVTRIVTLNAKDFAEFGCFEVIEPPLAAPPA